MFTPSREIEVIDAIKALTGPDFTEEIWKTLENEKPEILSNCRWFRFSKNKLETVIDGEGWQQIEYLLFDYPLDRGFPDR